MSDMKLINNWIVDINKFACDSLRHNHPETQVRNEYVENFLILHKECKKLCEKFSLISSSAPKESVTNGKDKEEEGDNENDDTDGDKNDYQLSSELFEVEEFLVICFGDSKNSNKLALNLKVRLKGYGPN